MHSSITFFRRRESSSFGMTTIIFTPTIIFSKLRKLCKMLCDSWVQWLHQDTWVQWLSVAGGLVRNQAAISIALKFVW